MERYFIYLDGKIYGRVNDYNEAVDIYFKLRNKYPQSLIKLEDTILDTTEKETLLPKRRHKKVLSTLQTGRF